MIIIQVTRCTVQVQTLLWQSKRQTHPRTRGTSPYFEEERSERPQPTSRPRSRDPARVRSVVPGSAGPESGARVRQCRRSSADERHAMYFVADSARHLLTPQLRRSLESMLFPTGLCIPRYKPLSLHSRQHRFVTSHVAASTLHALRYLAGSFSLRQQLSQWTV